MSFNALSFYQTNKGCIDLLVERDKLALFMLFFLCRESPLSIERLKHHIGVPVERYDQVVARLIGNGLLTLAEGHLSITEEGKETLEILGFLEPADLVKVPRSVLPVIKVVGIGGGGCNAINRLMQEGVHGIEIVAINTDALALERVTAHSRVLIGSKLTRGLGVGGDPELGRAAAEESKDKLSEIVQGVDMLFIVAGMGGGAGSGAAPVVARIAREAGAVTMAVVTKPFSFEGQHRRIVAEEGISLLTKVTDTTIVIPNDRFLSVVDPRVTVDIAFKLVDLKLINMIKQATTAIAELITTPGLINLDFADVKTIMTHAGVAHMAIGRGSGQQRAVKAARAALQDPLLEISLDAASGIIFQISGGEDITLGEMNAAAEVIAKAVDPDAHIIFGVSYDPKMKDSVQITLIATGVRGELEEVPYYSKEFVAEEKELDVPAFLRGSPRERRIIGRMK